MTEIRLAPDGAPITGAPPELTVELVAEGAEGPFAVTLIVDGRPLETRQLAAGASTVRLPRALSAGRHTLGAASGAARAEIEVSVLPGLLSLVPPLIAIGLALLFKDVLVSLALGVFSGALILNSFHPIVAFARSIDQFVVPSLADSDRASIVIFSTLLGGMVGVIGASGGTRGIVERLTKLATNARRGQLATWALGVAIFFDDYANTLIVGNTMRPITDRLRISREKLAYIVDSTAAPVASVVPISTWIGFEIGLIAAAFTQLGIDDDYNAYGVLLGSIAYRFYPIFALVLGFAIAVSRRDAGPMLAAERRAATTGKLVADGDTPLAMESADALEPPAGAPLRAVNALAPIGAVVAVTLVGLYVTGRPGVDPADHPSVFAFLREVFSASNSFHALLWGSLAGVTLAIVLALAQRILTVTQSMKAMVEGFRSMLLALVVLILAWSIGAVCEQLNTADYVVGLTEGVLAPHWLPVLVFLASAAISFATGASWGTMAILMPLVIPICHQLATAAALPVGSPTYTTLLVGTVSSVLAGSVWGDHCSPISDTTILSSMASGCDHIAHVRTQIPYALFAGLLGMALGDIPTAFGLSPWISLATGSAIIVLAVRFLARPVS
ncbi:MAG: Na+/H+ antiporter NhaC family protein [Thermoanaerobaculia bacterium]|nr:Na+/H+ antiporter NhaC family protein [Thermoanaerobaculia bacterium]